jgi:hypothetical protein
VVRKIWCGMVEDREDPEAMAGSPRRSCNLFMLHVNVDPTLINLKEIIMAKNIPLKLLLYMHSNRASSSPHLNNSGRWDSSPVFRHKPRKEPMHMSVGNMTGFAAA